jgi:hypothetical protein
MILSNMNFLLSMFAGLPRLILLFQFWKYKRMIKIRKYGKYGRKAN